MKSRDKRSQSAKGNMVQTIYNRLLSDIALKYGSDLMSPPDEVPMNWILHEGPQVDKKILVLIEARGRDENISSAGAFQDFLESLRQEVLELVPDWLLPLLVPFLDHLVMAPGTFAGTWRDNPLWKRDGSRRSDAELLGDIRTLLVFGYKAEFAPNEDQIKASQEAFIQNDQACSMWTQHLLDASTPGAAPRPRGLRAVLDVARSAIQRIVANIDWPNITPSHGPGAVYPSKRPSEKSGFDTVYSSIQRFYPFDEYFLSGKHSLADSVIEWEKLKEADKIVCNLIAVPKDSRGPRLICVHPAEAIWIQQGQRVLLEHAIENHSLTKSRINFRDQSVNGKIALESSENGCFATIDLKDASDRVSCGLVRYLFGDFVYEILSCARASAVRLLDGRVIDLEKWAPMGNCLTFPVESLVFWSIARAAISYYHGPSSAFDDVYVFGDDILVRSEYVKEVTWGLQLVGLLVNSSKSFSNGFFRESCGVDAYRGIEVTPLRLRVSEISTVSDALSLCSTGHQARERGLETLASSVYLIVSHWCGRRLPLSNDPSTQGLYEWVLMDLGNLTKYEETLRWNSKLHRWEIPLFLNAGSSDRACGHAWMHVLDSLIRLQRECHLDRTPDKQITVEGFVSNDGVRYWTLGIPASLVYLVPAPYRPALVQNGERSELVVSSYEEAAIVRSVCSRSRLRKETAPWVSERGTDYPVPHRVRLNRGYARINPS